MLKYLWKLKRYIYNFVEYYKLEVEFWWRLILKRFFSALKEEKQISFITNLLMRQIANHVNKFREYNLYLIKYYIKISI